MGETWEVGLRIDVHQHLWPEEFVEALRRRARPPRLTGWTLHLDGEADFAVDPAQHDPVVRAAEVRAQGASLVLVSLSSPLGIEWLAPEQAYPLIDAYHRGAAALPAPFRAWAAACLSEVDPAALREQLGRGFVGLQLPATALADPAGYARCAPLLDLLEEVGLPLFVHPGAAPPAAPVPSWWPALVPYVHQMHQAWYAFRAFGRPRHPRLRVCFAMLAGLAPLHGERLAVRGGTPGVVDPSIFLDTSSYGPRAIDATIRALGVDGIVFGTDHPYAGPADMRLGVAAEHAIVATNPARLLALKGDHR
ncbi:amidohydrolase family protein [Phytohabitans rumicis]|uniref:Amidohydrolase-related domain-containing protein n=1 Tax=Phytohabitans rumicis TaxID=1076125 RepID=A0A6V8KW63_9ACTN|nr:amidohydrolase family protein [Phytohabitans rumicis]GFJ86978.1 hypothetical protein Prum_006200 [Phytohabitans rumicis]